MLRFAPCFPQAVYVTSLSAELKNEATPEKLRQLCGLMLKNAFDSENEQLAYNKQARWREQPPAVKAQVKNDVSFNRSAPVLARMRPSVFPLQPKL